MLTGWERGGRRVDPGVRGVHRKGTCEQGVLEEKNHLGLAVWAGLVLVDVSQECEQEGE